MNKKWYHLTVAISLIAQWFAAAFGPVDTAYAAIPAVPIGKTAVATKTVREEQPIAQVVDHESSPTCSLNAPVFTGGDFEIELSGSYANSNDWGATLFWGHDSASVSFPGFSGSFSEPHTYPPGYGTWNFELVVEGPEGTTTCAGSVTFEPPPGPTCSIEVTIVSQKDRSVGAAVTWVNGFEHGWHLLYWGDESVTGAEPVGWQGESGITIAYPHQYPSDGTWTLRAVVVGPVEEGGCTAEVAIGQPAPSPSCPECESPQWETIPEDGVALKFYSRGPCTICEETNTLHLEVWARLEGYEYFEAFYKGELLKAKKADEETMAGDVWRLDFRFTWLEDGQDFSVWADYANGVRIRDVATFLKYTVCSDAPGLDDISQDGVATWQDGHQRSDWAKFVWKDLGLVDDYEEGLDWANQLKEASSLALPRT